MKKENGKMAVVRTDLLEDLAKREQIRVLLGLARQGDFSIIQWVSPLAALPEEGSYVLIKQQFPGESAVCCQAAYENGSFWAVGCDAERPLAENQVAAWAYAPYDGRVTLLGRLTAGRR